VGCDVTPEFKKAVLEVAKRMDGLEEEGAIGELRETTRSGGGVLVPMHWA